MATDCSFRLGNLSCEASNFVMASLGVLVCFLAALIVFTGIGLLVHVLILWVNRRRSRNLTGESDFGRLRSFLASLLGSNANGSTADVPMGPRNSRLWNNLNLLGDMTPPPSYDQVMAMVDLSGNADGPDAVGELVPGNVDGPEGGDGEHEAGVDADGGHISNGDIVDHDRDVGIWV